jgi:3-oxoacyl-[acyl-carrier protein] reductase
MQVDLTGKIALVTGASRNIGRATALALAEVGADLVLCTRHSGKELEDVAAEARKLSRKVFVCACDVTSEQDVKSMIAGAMDVFGHIDIVVNNATSRVHGKLVDLSFEDWSQAIGANLNGPFLVSRAVAPAMIQRKWGRIINYSGNSAYRGGSLPMATVKMGVVGFTRSLAKQLGKHNITVNAIAPGSVAGTREAGTERQSDIDGTVSKDLPIQRTGTPEEVAALVVYLSGEGASYITGQSIAINGGAHFIG